MSRIADVLQKARERNVDRHVDPPGPSHRSIADVKVPWSLRGGLALQTEVAPPEPIQIDEPARDQPLPRTRPTRVETPAAESRPGPSADTAGNEAVLSLVRELFLTEKARSNRHVVFTSVDYSPGFISFVIQIAEALAEQSSGPVYLVDTDLNSPSLHARFDLEEGKVGFSDALAKHGALADYAHEANAASNLWVVPAGLHIGSDMGDADTHRHIARLLDTPDYVIACAAAIGTSSDVELIGKLFDGVVLVVKPGVTSLDATRRAANAIEASRSQLLGTILENPERTDPAPVPKRPEVVETRTPTAQVSAPAARPVAAPAKPTRVATPAAENRPSPSADTAANAAILSLMHELFLTDQARSNRHVLFTPVDYSPFAVDLVIQIATALANQSSGPVYLVDTDLYSPSLHARFDLEGKVGLSDALKSDGSLRNFAHRADAASNLWLVPAGLRFGLDVGDADSHDRIATLLDTADYVLGCAAAIGNCSDAELIGNLFDGVVLVVQPGTTTADATRRAANAIEASNSHLLGTILENRGRTDPS